MKNSMLNPNVSFNFHVSGPAVPFDPVNDDAWSDLMLRVHNGESDPRSNLYGCEYRLEPVEITRQSVIPWSAVFAPL